MIEQVLKRPNLAKAYSHVFSNKGSAGVDGMQLSDLESHLKENGVSIIASIHQGEYLPQSILGITIPKSNGKT